MPNNTRRSTLDACYYKNTIPVVAASHNQSINQNTLFM